ncbi:DMT family transporter [Frigidibacter sp. ROC022]|uniref:DMT family transporter n=1 Tax=Frigidibacter sp. ROC022 TaxID=2971796 RepID=UPI00215A7376|nr:DMT family transporter [Frigidibacter sp. ROC022]MCR8723686.1 DMT family transporter [Frigidibacter sp. ROC022]
MNDNLRAALLMIAAMAGLSAEDLFIKMLLDRVPMGEILLILGTGGTLAMFVVARIRGDRLLDPLMLSRPVLIRNGAEMAAQVLGFTALALLPLSLVTSIGQAAPIVTTLGAALFLGEVVGWRRWSAIFVGLIGVLMILRPGSEAFQPAMILSALAVCCIAARDLATRRAPRELGTMPLNFWGYATTIPSGLLMLIFGGQAPVWPEPMDQVILAAAVVMGVSFYFILTLALRMGESSVVVPLRYTRLVFVLILAALVLGERPSAMMLAGAALVTLSGLYTLLREARLKRRRRQRPSPEPMPPL